MLGPGLDVRGGITSIERVMLENAPADIEIRHVATFAGEARLRRAASREVRSTSMTPDFSSSSWC